MTRPGVRAVAVLAALFLLLGSCGREPTGLGRARGALAFAPRFASVLAGDLVDIATVRVRLVRPGASAAALDTVVAFAASQDSIVLALTVPLEEPEEQFILTLAMATAQGDTVFRSSPMPVTASTNPLGPPVATPVVEYVGVGATATGVRFVNPPTTAGFNATVLLVAEAFDGQGAAIADTPIGFELVTPGDSVRGTFADPAVGSLVTRTVRGPLAVRAVLLTAQRVDHTIEVVPTATALQSVSGTGQSASVGATLPAPLVARVVAADALGVQGIAVDFTVARGADTLAVVRDTSDAQGLVSHAPVLDTVPGLHTITARVVGQAFAPVTFTATAAVGPAAALRFTVEPTAVASGATIAPAVQVTAVDLFGNPSTAFTGVVTLAMAANPQGAALGGTLARAAVAGVATFGDLTLTGVGTGLTLQASGTGLTPDTSAAFDITTGPPARLEISVQPAPATAGATFPVAIVVAVRDANGVTVPTATNAVTIAILDDPGSGVLQGTTTVAAVAGLAVFSDLRIDQAATGYTLRVTSGALTSDTTAGFDVAAAAVSGLAFSVQPPSTANVATPFAVAVAARDAFGNAVASFTGNVTVAIGTNPAGGTLSGTTTRAAVAGVATFTGLAIDNLGTGYTLAASSAGLTAAASNPFDVTVPPLVNAWINTSGGNWSAAANWSRGTVPTIGETVWIKQSGSYTVTFDVVASVARMEIGGASGQQTLAIGGGTMTMTDSVLVAATGAVALSDGTIGGAGSMLVDGSLVWSGGALNGTGATVRTTPASSLVISGTATRTLSNVALEVGGAATWLGTHQVNSGTGGTLRVLAGGVLEVQGDPTISYNLGGTASQVVNLGTVVRSTSAGVATFALPLDNDGLLTVASGTLRFASGTTGGSADGAFSVNAAGSLMFDGGTFVLGAASAVGGAGTVQVSAGIVNANGPWSIGGTLALTGGTLNFGTAASTAAVVSIAGGTLGGASGGVLSVTTSLTFTSGALNGNGGTVAVPVGATLLINGTTTRTISNTILELGGTGVWTGTHQVNSGSGGTIRVLAGGTLDIQGDPTISYNLGGTTSQFVNLGTVVRSTSAGTASFAVPIDNDGAWSVTSGVHRLLNGTTAGTSDGAFAAAAGATLDFNGGTFTLGAPSEVSGAGTVQVSGGSVNANGAWTIAGLLSVTGGTLNLGATASAASNVSVNGGTLGGAAGGLLDATTTLTFTSGAIAGTGGVTRVGAGGTLLINGTATRTVSNQTLELAGSGVWTGTHQVNSGSGGAIRVVAGGVLDIQGDATMTYNLGGAVSQFVNLGTVERSTSAGVMTLSVPVDNDGSWTVTNGTQRLLNGTIAGTADGAWVANAGATLDFNGGVFALGAPSSVSGAGTVAVTGGTVNAAGPWAVGGTVAVSGGAFNYGALSGTAAVVTLSGGAIGGSAGGLLTVPTSLTWSGGAFSGSGATVRVPIGGSMSSVGGATRTLSNMIVELAGTGTWSGTHAVNSGNGGRFRVLPSGTLDIQGDPTLQYNLGGATTRFENLGTLLRSTSAGTATMLVTVIDSGVTSVTSGVLNLNSGGILAGTHTLAAGAQLHLTGGTFTLQPSLTAAGPGFAALVGATLNGLAPGDTVRFENLRASTGTLAPAAGSAVRVSSVFTWDGNAQLSGGGTTVIPAGASAVLSGPATRTLNGHTVDIEGAGVWADAFTINSGNGAVLRVRPAGSLTVAPAPASTAALTYNLGGAQSVLDLQGTFLLNSSATFAVTASVQLPGTAAVSAGTVVLGGGSVLSGDLFVDAPAVVDLAGGNHALAHGFLETGAGLVRHSGGTLLTTTAADTAEFTRFELSTGAITASGTVVVSDHFAWSSSGQIGGGGRLITTDTALIAGAATRTLTGGAVLQLEGITRYASAATINSGNGARIENAPSGQFEWSGGGSFLYNLGGPVSTFENRGLVSFSGTAATSAFVVDTTGSAIGVAAAGTLTLLGGGRLGSSPQLAGTLELGGGTLSLQAGATIAASTGRLLLSGGTLTTDSATTSIARLDMTGGTLAHEGTLTIGTGFNWDGGNITSNVAGLGGTTIIPSGGSFVINGAAVRTFSGSHTLDLQQGSVVIHAASGNINSGSGATIRNATTFDKQGGGSILSNLGGVASTFRNLSTGTLVSSGATTGVIGFPVENQGGQFQVTGDTLRLSGGSIGSFTGNVVAAANPLQLATGTYSLTGPLNVSGADGGLHLVNASLAIFGNTVTVAGDLNVTANSLVPMTNPAAVIDVRGDVTYAGGNAALTAGLLSIGGDFAQAGSTNAFAASGTHRTQFNGAARQTISFASALSFFNALELGTPATSGRIDLLTDATAASVADTTAAISDTIFSSVNATLSAGVATLSTTVFDGAELFLTSPTGAHQINTIRFQNMDPTATFVRVERNFGFDVTLAGATFATTPTTGVYVSMRQLTGPTAPVSLLLPAPVTPSAPAGRYQRSSATVQLPNVVWAGVTNPP